MTDDVNSPVAVELSDALNGLGQGVLLFDHTGRLVLSNLAAERILGPNLDMIRSNGWPACVMLLGSGGGEENAVTAAVNRARLTSEPVRFHAELGGAYTPCWASVVYSPEGRPYTLISIEIPDWEPLSELMAVFRDEAGTAIDTMRGHIGLVSQLASRPPEKLSKEKLSGQIRGFVEVLDTHVGRLQALMEVMGRLEAIRTGTLAREIAGDVRKIVLDEWFEDVLEELADEWASDGDDAPDYRDRLVVNIPEGLEIETSPRYLGRILRDMIRNALIYSPDDSTVAIRARADVHGRFVQIDVIDEGIGVRASEASRVFAPFQRARQPHVIGEFGYGISLYLAKHEIEAMGGRIWFESEEGVGSTFSIKVPISLRDQLSGGSSGSPATGT